MKQECGVFIESNVGYRFAGRVDSIREAARLVHGLKCGWMVMNYTNESAVSHLDIQYKNCTMKRNLRFRQSLMDAIGRL